MEKNYIFHQRLKEQCKKINKPIYCVEQELNYPKSALNNYRYGKIPSGVRLLELANYLDVTPEYLLGLSDMKLPYNKITLDKLSEEELTILIKYRRLSFSEKSKLCGYLDALLDA